MQLQCLSSNGLCDSNWDDLPAIFCRKGSSIPMWGSSRVVAKWFSILTCTSPKARQQDQSLPGISSDVFIKGYPNSEEMEQWFYVFVFVFAFVLCLCPLSLRSVESRESENVYVTFMVGCSLQVEGSIKGLRPCGFWWCSGRNHA